MLTILMVLMVFDSYPSVMAFSHQELYNNYKNKYTKTLLFVIRRRVNVTAAARFKSRIGFQIIIALEVIPKISFLFKGFKCSVKV